MTGRLNIALLIYFSHQGTRLDVHVPNLRKEVKDVGRTSEFLTVPMSSSERRRTSSPISKIAEFDLCRAWMGYEYSWNRCSILPVGVVQDHCYLPVRSILGDQRKLRAI